MDDDPDVVTHPTMRMWLRLDGIAQVVLTPGATLRLEDATAATASMARLTGGQRRPLIVDLRGGGSQDRAARVELARRNDLVSAVALIVDSPLSRMLGNFFVNVNRPSYPTRLCDDEASATVWLHEAAD